MKKDTKLGYETTLHRCNVMCMKKTNKVFTCRSIRMMVSTALLATATYCFLFYVNPPRFNGSHIKVYPHGVEHPFPLANDDELYQEIDKWLMQKRLCYPSFSLYYPHLGLFEQESSDTSRGTISVIVWDRKVIYCYGNGVQLVVCFFSKNDAEIKDKIERWCDIQEWSCPHCVDPRRTKDNRIKY